jgi:hypothetical protein
VVGGNGNGPDCWPGKRFHSCLVRSVMVMVVWVSMIKVCSNFGLLVVEMVQNLVKLCVEMVVEFLVVVVRKFKVGTVW